MLLTISLVAPFDKPLDILSSYGANRMGLIVCFFCDDLKALQNAEIAMLAAPLFREYCKAIGMYLG